MYRSYIVTSLHALLASNNYGFTLVVVFKSPFCDVPTTMNEDTIKSEICSLATCTYSITKLL